MPDLAPTATPRYEIRYTVLGQGHRFGFRQPRDSVADHEAVLTKVKAWLNALTPYRYDSFSLVSGVFIPQDSGVSLPIDIAPAVPDVGAISSSGIPASAKALETRFVARSQGGARSSVSLFSMQNPFGFGTIGQDFRVTTSENATYAAAITALSELAPAFCGIDSEDLVWYPYVNMKYNDYWVGQLRG